MLLSVTGRNNPTDETNHGKVAKGAGGWLHLSPRRERGTAIPCILSSTLTLPPPTMSNTQPSTDPTDRDDASPRARRRWVRPFLVVLGAGCAVALLVWFVVIPYPRGLESGDAGITALMEQRLEEARAAGDTLAIRRQWVPLDEISPNLRRAVVVAEDYRFREHEGIDWVSLADEVKWTGDDEFGWSSTADLRALRDALGYVWTNRSELRGRSTLTQQLAKNLYFGTDRSLLRKAMEAVVAKRLERQLEKDRILELYLNIVEWGPGVFGAEAAAQAYFGRTAASLSLWQAATLAATLPHPLTSNLHTRPGRMVWRRNHILDRIDPARGIPASPSPIPPPDFGAEFDPTGRPVSLPATRPLGGGDSVARPDSLAPSDSLAAPDSVTRPDTVARPDTVLRPDTVARPDTIARPAFRESPQEIGRLRIARPGIAPSTSSPSRTTKTPFTRTQGMPADG